MNDFEKYLNSINFTTVVDDLENPNSDNEHGLHYIFQQYVSQVVNDEIDISCSYHYNLDSSKEIDYMMITICSKGKKIATFNTTEELKEYYNNVVNIDKKIELYHQWEYKQFAKDMIKNALRDIKFGIVDFIKAKFMILKIKLRR